MRLYLIKQIINEVISIFISFSVKYPDTFWKLCVSLSNMSRRTPNMYTYRYTQLTPNWLQKHDLKVMIRNQKIKGTFILGMLFSE